MRNLLLSVATATLLLACSPPASHDKAGTPPAPALVCNEVGPDASKQVRVEDESAVASAAADLRGGSITPGTYDLIRARRIGAATGWTGTRAVALDIVETEGGVTFNWAGAGADGARDTWTASFSEAPQPRLAYTCGRMGEVSAQFSAQGNALQLHLPDGANGELALDFQRRG